MQACDFSFRGETLDEHGYILCDFDGSSSPSVVTTDSQRNFTSISMFGGRYKPFIYNLYDDALVVEMCICKNSDDDLVISPSEVATIKRWLNSPIASELRLGGDNYEGIFWMGSFNVEEIHLAHECVGLKLTFISTAPFGYKNTVEYSGTASANDVVNIIDTSDEEGYIYPDITIVLQESGDLVISNSYDQRDTIISNCQEGEMIVFTSLLQVFSNYAGHNVLNDFNYNFLRIQNSYGNKQNQISFNLPCEYSITYNPIAKVVVA